MLYLIGIGALAGIALRILQAGLEPGRAQKVVTGVGVLVCLAFAVALGVHWYTYATAAPAAGNLGL